MPNIKYMGGKAFSLSASILDLELVCAKCGYTRLLQATKTMLDAHISGFAKVGCPKCDWVATFYIAYHKDVKYDARNISNKPITGEWWLEPEDQIEKKG